MLILQTLYLLHALKNVQFMPLNFAILNSENGAFHIVVVVVIIFTFLHLLFYYGL